MTNFAVNWDRNTIQRLQCDGFVSCELYRAMFQTDKGGGLAAASRERHAIVRVLLIALGAAGRAA